MSTGADVVAHLLRRAGFGAEEPDLVAFCALDLAEGIDRLFDRSAEPPDVMPATLLDPNENHWTQWALCVQEWLERMAVTPTPLVEKMTMFWHGHFVSGIDKVGSMGAMWQQIATYRRLCFGNLKDLARAMAVEPAMLRYLDNDVSRAGTPNLNFARELFELFLLGVGNYTEHDIAESARAWTGHTIDAATGAYTFRADWHDDGDKTIFGVTRNFDGTDVIDLVFSLPATRRACARFIVGELWAYLAHPSPPAALIDELAGVFLDADFEIVPLLRAIFLHPAFLADHARDGLVRSPVEWCVALRRATGVPFAESHPEWWLGAMGQLPYSPPDVSGWRSNEYWLSTTAAAARADYAAHVAWKARGAGTLMETLGMTAPAAVEVALERFGVSGASTVTKNAIGTWLVAQRSVPWTGWNQVQGIMVLAALSPEMQLA